MGRKAKYATVAKYQPYLDHARKFFKIPEDVFIELRFAFFKHKGGHARYYNMRYFEIALVKDGTHSWILQAILHELKHVEQRVTGRYVSIGRLDKIKWEGEEYGFYTLTRNKNKKNNRKNYFESPWEIEAREAEEMATIVFPNDSLPTEKVIVGKVGGVTFYKG